MQISVPKNIIDGIVEQFGCSRDEAVHAYLESSRKAEELYNRSLGEILGPRESPPSPGLFTPGEIKEHLDRYVIGQEEYKKRICIAASYHFAMIRYLRENPETKQVRRFRKKNTLIAGPSGSGKTYCIEVLGDLLQVPTLIIDSTDYTEAGFVGKSADDMIRELVDMAPGAGRKDQVRFVAENGGIIFIDEIDKKAREGGPVGHDISREGFQRSVLKLMERKLVPVENPFSPLSQIQEAMERQTGMQADAGEKMISTENILFILGGSFERIPESLEKIVKKRVDHGGQLDEEGSVVIRGFDDSELKDEKEKYKSYYPMALADDYIRFGLLPELVGRAPIRTYVNLLSKNDLIRIMKETEDSILNQYILEFGLFQIDAEFSDEAVEFVAGLAENKKTGARALVSVWETILTDFQFELQGTGITRIRIDREVCERPSDALLKLMKRSPYLDFAEKTRREYGIEPIFSDEIRSYIEEKAAREKRDLTSTIQTLLSGLRTLNYMHRKGPVEITREMLDDPTYFDRLFARWYEEEKKKY